MLPNILIHDLRRLVRVLQVLICLAVAAQGLSAQTVIGGATPDASAILDLQSTSRGFLPPRLTTAQRNAVSNPPAGSLVFNTSINCLEMNAGTPAAPDWICLETPKQASSNGTAVVAAYGGPGCTGSGAVYGALQNGQVVSGAYLLLYADVTQTGAWALSASANGITFSGKGAFTTTGCQPVVLTGSGIPLAAGSFTWTTNSTPSGSGSASVNN